MSQIQGGLGVQGEAPYENPVAQNSVFASSQLQRLQSVAFVDRGNDQYWLIFSVAFTLYLELQVVQSVAPFLFEKVPAGQSTQSYDCSPLNRPAGHLRHQIVSQDLLRACWTRIWHWVA